MTKKTIALIYGGDSSEYEVSIKSGKHISGHLDRERYNVYEVLMKEADWRVLFSEEKSYLIDKADFSFVIPDESGIGGKRVKFDKALIMIHGTPGENGLLQAYFEMIGMKFTTCSATVSAISFDKYACKCYLRDTGVKLAKEQFIRRGDSYNAYDIAARMGLPLFVKPNNGGSSFGVTKVKHLQDLNDAIESAFKEDESVLVEEYIQGREMTNGVYEYNGELVRLPVTEIISNNEFFDYEAKYLGASREICPAEITSELSERIINTSHKIYRYLGCRGVVRVDYIVRGDEIYFLEINTVPGMTEMSLVPQQVRAAGMTIREFLNQLLG
ncbi:MAG: D-alanine--D-alanine ligase [Bacteroidetes bacterium HGW-Bacteroidetes-7]|jgi:D-alanine-D-alanine ligase|nr:MAG: D-alanine--D-alanine ligase [Bacteroidetes bacterium HGW-Bacteroidetes-7]